MLGRTLGLARSAGPRLLGGVIAATALGGMLPAVAAVVAKQIVDRVVLSGPGALGDVMVLLGLEAGIAVALVAASRGGTACRRLLGLRLADLVRQRLLERAAALELCELETPALQDALTRARKGASSHPVALLDRVATAARCGLAGLAALVVLLGVQPLATLLVIAATVPVFFAEARTARREFELQHRRTHTRREQGYLENVLSREDYAKEVRLLGLGAPLRDRFDRLASAMYDEQRSVVGAGVLHGLLAHGASTIALYAAYAVVVAQTLRGALTLGEMTMALALFRQTQQAISGGLAAASGAVGDRLHLADVFTLLDHPSSPPPPLELVGSGGPGLVFEDVGFTYPGSTAPALAGISLCVRPGEVLGIVGENGSGKSTLLKLMTGLYRVQCGRISLDGGPLPRVGDRRVAAMFQDFNRYKLSAADNISLGDITLDASDARLVRVARRSTADRVIDALPTGLEQRLGRCFPGGLDLSGGQWQKLALARALFRSGARLRVFDEPTAAIDADSEAAIFEELHRTRGGTATVVVAHRLAALVDADHIIVLHGGLVVEQGTHPELVALGGRYARAFALQSRAYAPSGGPPCDSQSWGPAMSAW